MKRTLLISVLFTFAACGPNAAELKRQYDWATGALAGGDEASALREFGALYAADPNYADVALIYGRLLFLAHRHGEAVEVLKDRPDRDSRYWLARSRAGSPEGRRAAIATLDRLVQDYPEDIRAWWLKAQLHRAGGETREALAAFEKIENHKRTIAQAAANLGRLNRKIGKSEKAEEFLRIARELAPDDPVVKAAQANEQFPIGRDQTPEQKP